MTTQKPPAPKPKAAALSADAHKALRFLAIKAAIFIAIPALAAVVAVYFTLK